MPKIWYKVVIIVVAVILLIILALFGTLVLNEYFPESREELTIDGESSKTLEIGSDINIVTYNLGYLSLDNTQDFFLDGGKNSRPQSATNVTKNLAALKNFMDTQDSDIYLFQEVDTNAKRSYYTNEYEALKQEFKGNSAYAKVYDSLYIPFPVFGSLGHVESGLMTLNKYELNSATRVALPDAFNMPKKSVMYKNCVTEERVKIKDKTQELVIYNVELDRYGNKAKEQLDVLLASMKEEYDKGNYVIAGGDYSLNFPDIDLTQFPILEKSNFVPETLSYDLLPENFKFATDYSKPSARLLNEEYSGNYDNTQLYITDGYIVSGNIEINKVETIENNFSYSNHQPVSISIKLK